MAHNRRGRGGFRMEGRDNNNNDMEEIKRMIQQLVDRMARIETRNMEDESFDGEQDDNPFHHRAPLGESDERGRGGRLFNNYAACYFNMKVDVPKFKGKIQANKFIDWLNPVEQIFDYKEVQDEIKINFDEPPIFDNYQEEEEEITWSDHGESLVIQRVLNASKAEDDPNWLRHNNFHTKCTASGKVCHVIIDGVSCENIVSQEMVNKFSFKTKKSLESYKLSWIENRNDVVANQQCLVAFSFGKKYKEIGDKHCRHTEFQEGDSVRRNLRNEWFLHGKYDKLNDRGGCPYKVYDHGRNEVVGLDSRASHFQPGESDAGASNELSSRPKRKSEYELSNRPKSKSKAPSYLKGLLLKIILAFLILMYLFIS